MFSWALQFEENGKSKQKVANWVKSTTSFPISSPLPNMSSGVEIRTNLKVHTSQKLCKQGVEIRTNLKVHTSQKLCKQGRGTGHDEPKLKQSLLNGPFLCKSAIRSDIKGTRNLLKRIGSKSDQKFAWFYKGRQGARIIAIWRNSCRLNQLSEDLHLHRLLLLK